MQRIATFDILIKKIIDTKTYKKDVYDIYKYGLDQYNNSYILYKYYGETEPSYESKKNQPGRLWIRKKDHPFAFPAFAYQYQNAKIDDEYSILSTVVKSECASTNLTSNGGCIYDFEFSKDRKIMAIVAKNTLTASNGKSPIQRYETAEILVSKVSQEEYDDGSSEIIFYDAAVNEAESVGKRLPNGDYYIQKYNSGSDVQSAKFFIGMGFRGNTDFWFGFVDKNIDNNITTIPDTFSFNAIGYYITNGIQSFNISTEQLNGAKPLGGDIVCTFYDDIRAALTFRVETSLASDTKKSSYLVKNNITSASIESPDGDWGDINSFDVFNEDIIILKFTLNTSGSEIASNSDVNILNIHADMSYLPLHDGISSELSICNSDISANEYFNIELLGRSKNNLDFYINMANPNPDPYFTEDTIRENFKFGRVYEDHQDYFDKSFRIIQNPGIHNNINETINVGGRGVDFISCDNGKKTLTWCTNISKMESLSDDY